MIKAGDDEVEFEDLCPPDKTKKTVACQAFVSVDDFCISGLHRY